MTLFLKLSIRRKARAEEFLADVQPVPHLTEDERDLLCQPLRKEDNNISAVDGAECSSKTVLHPSGIDPKSGLDASCEFDLNSFGKIIAKDDNQENVDGVPMPDPLSYYFDNNHQDIAAVPVENPDLSKTFHPSFDQAAIEAVNIGSFIKDPVLQPTVFRFLCGKFFSTPNPSVIQSNRMIRPYGVVCHSSAINTGAGKLSTFPVYIYPVSIPLVNNQDGNIKSSCFCSSRKGLGLPDIEIN